MPQKFITAEAISKRIDKFALFHATPIHVVCSLSFQELINDIYESSVKNSRFSIFHAQGY